METSELLEQYEIVCKDIGRLRSAQAVLSGLIGSPLPAAMEAIECEISRLTNLKDGYIELMKRL